MASGQFVTVKLMRGGSDTPWGFRLQGGQEFAMPLSVVKVSASLRTCCAICFAYHLCNSECPA